MRVKLEKLESWIERNHRLVLALILGCSLFLCLALFDPKPNCGGDNASYIILAQSILQDHVYSMSSATGIQEPHTQYPFGYPLLLTPLIALFGSNLLALKFFSLVMTLGCVILFSVLLRPLFPPLHWAAITLAVALNPEIINFSHWILSEIPYLFFSFLSIILLLKSETKERGRSEYWFWSALLCIAFTAHIRSIGLMCAFAGFTYYILHRNWRKLLIYTLGLTILITPWMIRNSMVSKRTSPYVRVILSKDHYDPELGTVGIGEMAARVLDNVKEYSTGAISAAILGSEVLQDGRTLTVALISFASTLLILLGLFRNLFARAGIMELYTLAYTGILLIWPEIWNDIRFLVPIIPFLLMYLVDGANTLFCSLQRKLPAHGTFSAAVALLVAIIALGVQIVRIPANSQMVSQYINGDQYAGYLASWRHLFEAADWARENTPGSSVFTVRKPSLFYLHSGRKSTIYPFSRNVDSVFARILKTDYLVLHGLKGIEPLETYHRTTIEYLEPVMEKYRYNFKFAFKTEYPRTHVLEVDRYWNKEKELEKLRKDSELDPSDKAAAMGAAEILMERGQLDSAEVFIQRILTSHYGSLPDFLQIIKLYIQHENPDRAREILLAELEKASSGTLYAILAHVNKALGLEEESARCLNRAFSLGVTDLGLTAIGKKLNIELTSIQDTTFSDR